MTFNFKTAFSVSLLAMILVASFTQIGQAQNWPVNQPSGVSPVPQYVPRYPLEKTKVPTTNIPPTKIADPYKPSAGSQPQPLKSSNGVKPQASQQAVTSKIAPKPAAKPTKKPTAKPTKKTAKAKKKVPPHYGVDYSIYRDQNVFPIDPRKPNSPCVRPCGNGGCCGGCGGNLPGVNGRPYMEKEPGGCSCQQKNPTSHPQFNLHWPRPFSALLDERHPNLAAERYDACPDKRIVDVFDRLSTLKLSGYKRTDNAYSGEGSDPYGCLGESKLGTRVTGVGYRFPSEPVQRGLQNGQGNSGW